jgi:Zn-dependent peptidase ImmA (M78 family)
MGEMTRDQREHHEANEFACQLLVPDALLEKVDLSKVDLASDKAVSDLAKKFRVPVYVICKRISEFAREKYRLSITAAPKATQVTATDSKPQPTQSV